MAEDMTPERWAELTAEAERSGNSLVLFGPAVVTVRREDIETAIQQLGEMDDDRRRHVLASVQEAIDAALVRLDELTDRERQNLCDDIGIWFANLVDQGQHDEYRVDKNDPRFAIYRWKN